VGVEEKEVVVAKAPGRQDVVRGLVGIVKLEGDARGIPALYPEASSARDALGLGRLCSDAQSQGDEGGESKA
jgi:hypothetical protein